MLFVVGIFIGHSDSIRKMCAGCQTIHLFERTKLVPPESWQGLKTEQGGRERRQSQVICAQNTCESPNVFRNENERGLCMVEMFGTGLGRDITAACQNCG